MRPITEIIVHCTATLPGWMSNSPTSAKVDEVRRWHLGRGWSDIGYHFLIDRDGTIATGRPIERDGAHVAGRNKGTIGISLFGGHGSSADDAFSDNFTPEQNAALRDLIGSLQKTYGPVPVTGHNQWAAKACPGFRVGPWLDNAPAAATGPEIRPAGGLWALALQLIKGSRK
jgi:N-acetyl-anhydromuramyl-L-alanine amidase AmpD